MIFKRNHIYPLVLVLVVFVVWKWRQSQQQNYLSIAGTTFGSIAYNISYYSPEEINYKSAIDSLLEVFNQSLNHYHSDSELSRFNRDTTFNFELPYFYPVLKASKEIYEKTAGAFDPSIGHLINAWGFGPGQALDLDSAKVDSLKQIIYFSNIEFDRSRVWKIKPEIRLDFSAIAKGYGIDVVAEFLQARGIEDYFVEIGGEIRCNGVNREGEAWKVGIIDPRANLPTGQPLLIATIDGKAIATSANNFNYREKEGRKIVHTIDPQSGYPVEHNLLSASVIARDCMTADAFATAFMVMGVEKARQVLISNPELEAILVFSTKEGGLDYFVTDKLQPFVSGAE